MIHVVIRCHGCRTLRSLPEAEAHVLKPRRGYREPEGTLALPCKKCKMPVCCDVIGRFSGHRPKVRRVTTKLRAKVAAELIAVAGEMNGYLRHAGTVSVKHPVACHLQEAWTRYQSAVFGMNPDDIDVFDAWLARRNAARELRKAMHGTGD